MQKVKKEVNPVDWNTVDVETLADFHDVLGIEFVITSGKITKAIGGSSNG